MYTKWEWMALWNSKTDKSVNVVQPHKFVVVLTNFGGHVTLNGDEFQNFGPSRFLYCCLF